MFGCLLQQSTDRPTDCRSNLEHILLFGGCFDLSPRNLHEYAICSKHRDYLLNMFRQKNNCQVCVDIFNKKKRSTTSLRRISKYLALRIWHRQRVNLYDEF
jgi:hypothetical protein